METKFQTSFIPKDAIDVTSPVVPKKPVGMISFIATMIFVISVLVAGGVFFWRSYLSNEIIKKEDALNKNIKAFEPQTIDAYVRLNSRIDSAKELLSKHVAVSYFLEYLEDNTLQSVRFTDFKYETLPDGKANISLNGEAKSYNAVAFQSRVFGEERNFKGPIFSNLDLDQEGNVLFNFTTVVEPEFIAYRRYAVAKQKDLGNSTEPIPIIEGEGSGFLPLDIPKLEN